MAAELLSIIVPVYKSGEIAPELAARVKQALTAAGHAYELIMVNDCSPDDTWEHLAALAGRDENVRAISLRKNVGYDSAVMAGLNHAAGGYVVLMDDDLQHDPEDIPRLLVELQKGHDVVYANFLVKKQSLVKNIGSWFNGKVAEILINKPPEIYLSPFKVMRREIAREIIKYAGPFPYVDGLIYQVTSAIHQVPVPHHKRLRGTGNYGIIKSAGIWLNLATNFSTLPLRLSILLGFAITAIGLLLTVYMVAWELIYGGAPEGWATLMVIVMMLAGTQLVMLGIIGEYIGRTHLNVNKQPQYVVREKINLE